MVTQNRRTIIPSSESKLAEAVAGDVVKIRVADDRSADRFRVIWTLYQGMRDGRDAFITREYHTSDGDMILLQFYESERRTHRYDRNEGVILSNLHVQQSFVGPKREDYESLVRELKDAGIWEGL